METKGLVLAPIFTFLGQSSCCNCIQLGSHRDDYLGETMDGNVLFMQVASKTGVQHKFNYGHYSLQHGECTMVSRNSKKKPHHSSSIIVRRVDGTNL